MGVFFDYLINARTMDKTPSDGIDATSKSLWRFITNYPAGLDIPYPSGSPFGSVNQEDSIGATGSTGGTYTLTCGIRREEPTGDYITFTTAPIAFNAAAGVIRAAIDLAANGVIPNWTDNDIQVDTGTLSVNGIAIGYRGPSVENRKNLLTTIDGTLLTGGSPPGAFSQDQQGRPNRFYLASLNALGYFPGSFIPDYQVDPSVLNPQPPTAPDGYVDRFILQEIVKEAVYWEGRDFPEEWLRYLLKATGLR